MLLTALAFWFLGAVAGSFAGVIAERINTGQSWTADRSRCNACTRTLTALDMVPVFSWLASLGKCRSCGAGVPATYLATEFALGACFAAAYLKMGLSYALVPFLIALVVLAALVLYDLRHLMVPPAFSASLIAAALAYAALANESYREFGLVLLIAGVIALILFLFFALSGGRVMGLGDTPVAFALSLLAGTMAPLGLIYSFWVGAVVGIGILFARRSDTRMNTEVPFVPFMAAGFLLALLTQWNPFPFFVF